MNNIIKNGNENIRNKSKANTDTLSEPSKESLSIKKITTDTFVDFINLIIELAKYEQIPPPDQSAQKRLHHDCLGTHPLYTAYLAFLHHQPVGYLIIYDTYSSFLGLPSLFIEDIYIRKEYRRQGFGQQLFDFCKKLAQTKHYGRIEWNVYTWNTPAIRFYEKNKAQCLDKYYYRLDKNSF